MVNTSKTLPGGPVALKYSHISAVPPFRDDFWNRPKPWGDKLFTKNFLRVSGPKMSHCAKHFFAGCLHFPKICGIIFCGCWAFSDYIKLIECFPNIAYSLESEERHLKIAVNKEMKVYSNEGSIENWSIIASKYMETIFGRNFYECRNGFF